MNPNPLLLPAQRRRSMSNTREVVRRTLLPEKGLLGGSPTRIEELFSHTSVKKYGGMIVSLSSSHKLIKHILRFHKIIFRRVMLCSIPLSHYASNDRSLSCVPLVSLH
jgi:hypothetical protein